MGNSNNDKKSTQLGMPYGTANGRLRKMLMFDMAQELGRDTCHRCQETIESLKDFTVEHKSPWLDVDPDLFWDLRNIAFSHLDCNIKAGRRVKTEVCYRCKRNPARRNANGYAKECRACNSEMQKDYRAQRVED